MKQIIFCFIKILLYNVHIFCYQSADIIQLSMKKSSFLMHTQQISINNKTNRSRTNIEIPQADIISNNIIHSRNAQIIFATNRSKKLISADINNQQRQVWRRTQTNSFKKFKTQQTSRSNQLKESQHRYHDEFDNLSRRTTTSNNFNNTSRKKRKTVCIQLDQTQYTLFNGAQIRGQGHKMKSQPIQAFNFKQKIEKRINQKINLAKKMTPQIDQKIQRNPLIKISNLMPTSQSASLFKFDRFYDHCIKKLKKCINIYQKDLSKPKDKYYMQLKIQSHMLSKQLKEMRSSLIKKKEENGYMVDSGMGIIGKNINVKQIERNSINRGLSANFKKKISKIKNKIDKKNPFIGQQMQGWNIKLEKGDDFYI